MKKNIIITVLILMLSPLIAFANECRPGVTFGSAYTGSPTLTETQVQQQKDDVEKHTVDSVLAMPTSLGVQSGDAANNVVDFLSLLSVSGLGGSLFGESLTNDDDTLTISHNIDLGSTNAGKLKLSAAFDRSLELYSPLVEAMSSDQQEIFRSINEPGLQLGDDATFTLAYEFGVAGLGRANLSGLEEIFNAAIGFADISEYQQMQLTVTESIEPLSSEPYLTMLKGLDADETTIHSIIQKNTDNTEAVDFLENLCEALTGLEKATQLMAESEDQLVNALMLDKLENNRPQLNFNVSFTEKDELTGRDEVSAKLSYSWGAGASIHGMLKQSKTGECAAGNLDACYRNYLDYVRQNKDSIEQGNRFKLAIEYVDTDSYSYDGMDGFSFSQDGAEKFVGSIGYGRVLNSDGMLKNSRLDLEFKFEDVDGDPDRNDRAIGILSLSKKLESTEGLTFPFTLIYSNKPEYVQMNTSDKLAAHIGIKWDYGEAK